MAAGLGVDLDRWRREFDELMLRVSGRFARVEPRRRVAGVAAWWLVSELARKRARMAVPNDPPTCWMILVVLLASGTSGDGMSRKAPGVTSSPVLFT